MVWASAKFIRFFVSSVCALFLWGPGILLAQNYDSPGLGRKPVASHPQDYKPLGVRAGSFMLHPGAQLAVQWTDNAFFSTEKGIESDTIYHIRPYITAQSTWSRHSLNVSLAADIARYDKYGFRDYEDYFITLSGRVDVRNRSYLSYSANYMNLHEGLNSRQSEQGFEPTRYNLYGGSLGYDHTFNRLSLGVSYSHSWLDFDNAYSIVDGVINNQDRNRNGGTWMARAGYQFQTDKQAFLTYTGSKIKYEEEEDRNGYDRSGYAHSLTGGIAFSITGKLNGSVGVGYHIRSYDDALLPDTDGWGGSASLQWTATDLTSVYLQIATSVEESTSEFASGYLRTLYTLRADHELLRNLQINGFLSYSDNDYQLLEGAPPDARAWDEIWRAGLGLSYFINRHMFLNASYDYEQLRTNVPDDGYDVNTAWLVLGLEY